MRCAGQTGLVRAYPRSLHWELFGLGGSDGPDGDVHHQSSMHEPLIIGSKSIANR